MIALYSACKKAKLSNFQIDMIHFREGGYVKFVFLNPELRSLFFIKMPYRFPWPFSTIRIFSNLKIAKSKSFGNIILIKNRIILLQLSQKKLEFLKLFIFLIEQKTVEITTIFCENYKKMPKRTFDFNSYSLDFVIFKKLLFI